MDLPVKLEYDTTLAKQAYELAARWDAARSSPDLSQFKAEDIKDFNTNQMSGYLTHCLLPTFLIYHLAVVLLERLEDAYAALPSTHLIGMGKLYGISSTPNVEIRQRFFELALKDPKSDAAHIFAKEAAEWVVGHDGTNIVKGRMKFCRPIFRLVNRVDSELAVSTFKKDKESFHPIAQKLIERVRSYYFTFGEDRFYSHMCIQDLGLA